MGFKVFSNYMYMKLYNLKPFSVLHGFIISLRTWNNRTEATDIMAEGKHNFYWQSWLTSQALSNAKCNAKECNLSEFLRSLLNFPDTNLQCFSRKEVPEPNSHGRAKSRAKSQKKRGGLRGGISVRLSTRKLLTSQ